MKQQPQQSSTPSSRQRQHDSGGTDLISFRLDAEFRKLLSEQSAKQGEYSPNTFARKLLRRALSGTEHDELKHELEQLRGEIRKIREDMATLCFVLLIKAGNEDPKKAEAWVREHLAP